MTQCRRQRGFTLVELLVGLLVGLLVIASAVGVLSTQQTTTRITRAQQDLQQQARFVMDLIGRDIRAAGDFACVPGITPVNLMTSATSPSYPFNQAGLRGATYSNSAISTLPTWRGSTAVTQVRSDVLVAYGLLSTSLLAQSMSISSDLNLDVRRPFLDWKSGDVLLISDCLNAAVFSAASVVVNTTDSSRITVTVPTGAGVGKVYAKGSTIGRLTHAWYWISEPTGSPRGLYRQLASDSAPMLLGDLVQKMEIRYDIDTNADGLADTTDIDATAVTDWSKVMRVRIKLLMRSRDTALSEKMKYRFPSSATSDTLAEDMNLYQVVEQAIRVRNSTTGT